MFNEIELLVKNKEYAKALELLNNIHDEKYYSNKYYLLLAHVTFKCQKYEASEKAHSLVFSKNIQTTRAYLEYVAILKEKNAFSQAIDYLEKGLAQFPESVALYRTLITHLRLNKSIEHEEAICKKLLVVDSNDRTNYKLLIDVLLRQKSYSELKKYLDEAIEKFGEDDFLVPNIRYLAAVEDYEILIEKYTRLQNIDSKNNMIYVGKYRAYEALGNKKKAEQSLLEGLLSLENKEKILEILVNYYFKEKKYNDAIMYLKKLIKRKPHSMKFHIRLCTIYNSLEKYANSIEAFNAIDTLISNHEFNNEDIVSFNMLKGNTLYDLGHYAKAIEAFLETINLSPDSITAHFKLAMIYLKLNKFDDAKGSLEHILVLDRNHASADKYLVATERMRSSYKMKNKSIENLSLHLPKNSFDHVAYLDMLIESKGYNDGVSGYKKNINKPYTNQKLSIRSILYLLQKEDYSRACVSWERTLNEISYSDCLYLYREAHKFVFLNKEIGKIHRKTEKLLHKKIKKESVSLSNIQSIAILGGSNSIMTDGWIPAFTYNLTNLLNIPIDNYGLGGISSLYGLYISQEKEIFKKYDMVLFEYTLNDIYFNVEDAYNHQLLSSVVYSLICAAKEYNCKLVFVLMSPLDNMPLIQDNSCAITNLYRDIAHIESAFTFNISDIINHEDYSSSHFIEMLYRDNMHYTSTYAKRIADVFTEMLVHGTLFKKQVHPQHTEQTLLDNRAILDLSLLEPDEFKVLGTSTDVLRETSIISRKFLRIHGSSSISVSLPKGTKVLAILINSSEATGYIKVTFNDEVFIKNIFAERPINDPEKARIYLKQFTRVMIAQRQESILEISTSISQDEYLTLDKDTTSYEHKPKETLDKQELEIAGILIAREKERT